MSIIVQLSEKTNLVFVYERLSPLVYTAENLSTELLGHAQISFYLISNFCLDEMNEKS